MSGNGGEEAPRPRPLSGGLWTLFSWLRRDERNSSSDSLSSAGSDRTAISFSFLPPVNYTNGIPPLVVPPPGPPTDSYRKRVQERNQRRQHDRNITLHRKYGLYRSDCSNGYDAFSLPPTRRVTSELNTKRDRERRATSECFQGRVHVPGKRRAPLPPTRAASIEPITTLVRRTRKRRAPQPPVNRLQKIEEGNTHCKENKFDHKENMNPQTSQNQIVAINCDNQTGCRSEKYSKKDNVKEIKVRSEKSFLKHIFENKKRNSIETTSIKVLPNISELDKQAAEIIKSNKQNSTEKNNNVTQLNLSISKTQNSSCSAKGEYWFCIICLRKYDSSIVDCLYCSQKHKSASGDATIYTQTDKALPEKPSTSYHSNKDSKIEDKQKLKEMLKEMKDSLPKRQKHGINDSENAKNKNSVTEIVDKNNQVSDTPTLRIGTVMSEENTPQTKEKDSKRKEVHGDMRPGLNNVVITKHIVLEPSSKKIVTEKYTVNSSKLSSTGSQLEKSKDIIMPIKAKENLNTPLKISSLLNPIYVPKDNNKVESNPVSSTFKSNKETVVTNVESTDRLHHVPVTFTALATPLAQVPEIQVPKKEKISEELLNFNILNSTNKRGIGGDKDNAIIKSNQKEELNEVSSENLKLNKNGLESKSQDLTLTDTKGAFKKAPNVLTSNISERTENLELRISSTSNITDSDKINKKNQNTVVNERKLLDTIPEIVKKDDAVIENKDGKNLITKNTTQANILPLNNNKPSTSSGKDVKDQHSQRRALINQLEQSIAKGDERAAAEAAAKLAQLRLSCSVLSFSSQIMTTPPTSFVADINKLNTPEIATNQTKIASSPIIKPAQTTTQNKIKRTLAQATSKNVSPSQNTINANVATQKSVSQPSTSKQQNEKVSVKVWVEDKESARGPIHLQIQRQATMGDLRKEAEASLGLARHLQRWIVGKTLCTDDKALLADIAGADYSAPLYLCLVESEINKIKIQEIALDTKDSNETKNAKEKITSEGVELANFYTELVQLEQQALVPNAEAFECGICLEQGAPGAGAVLRDCVHEFCKQCLSDLVLHCEEPIIACPAMGCRGVLEEREIRALVPAEEYERWLARGLRAAESGTRNAFHCRTRDCTGWALCDQGVRRFPCPVCKHTNCVPCQAIHEDQTCEEYKAKLEEAAKSAEGGRTDDETRALLNSLIRRGEALECPECSALITKKWGCDWIKCSACKTEICWVTRGRRWGPNGRGDTSDGCRCGVDGKRCHPSCGYCH